MFYVVLNMRHMRSMLYDGTYCIEGSERHTYGEYSGTPLYKDTPE